MSLRKLLRFRKKLSPNYPVKTPKEMPKLTYDDLINAEAELGRTIFGPVPEGHQREFFEARQNVWIWHESYLDTSGAIKEITVRYEVRPAGVYKKSNVSKYKKITGDELDNFRMATKAYLNLVKTKLYC